MGVFTPPRRPAVLAGVALAVALGGWVGYQAWARGADRRAALALAETAAPADALPVLRAALDRHPDDADLLRATARAMSGSGALLADAEPVAARWCAAAPDDPEAHRVRFDLLRRMYRTDEAAAAGERALALNPGDQQTRTELARVYLFLGRHRDAARELRVLLAVPGLPHDALTVGLARAETDAGDPAAAALLLDALLARNPTHAEALSQRAALHFQAGEFEAAAATARRCRPADPKERETALYTLGLALGRLGKADEAAAAFAELKAIQDADRFTADTLNRVGDAAYQLRAAEARLAAGDAAGAAELANAALARAGPTRPALDLLARCYDRMNLPGPAAAARARAATLP